MKLFTKCVTYFLCFIFVYLFVPIFTTHIEITKTLCHVVIRTFILGLIGSFIVISVNFLVLVYGYYYKYKCTNLYVNLVSFLFAIPDLILGVLLLLLFSKIPVNIFDTRVGILIGYFCALTPICVYFLLKLVRQFPYGQIEAALSLGFSTHQIIVYLFIPYYTLELLYLYLMLLIHTFSIFDIILIIASFPKTVPLYIFELYFSYDYTTIKSLVFVVCIIIAFLYTILKMVEKQLNHRRF